MRLGVDLGGTKIEIVALNAAGDELLRERIPTPQGNYGATVQAIADLVLGAEQRLGQRGTVGVGTPGSESLRNGLIRNANSTCLNGQALRQDLMRLLGRDIRLANDANCFALSEAIDGAATAADIVFGVILGTGVGGGVVIHRQVLCGANAIAGEWGHNPLPAERNDDLPGPACYCGRYGCIEAYLSGPALALDHHRHTGQTLAAEAIATAANAGDVASESTLRRYEGRLARALATVINVLDPEVIVLGGGLSRLERLYHHLPVLCRPHVFSDDFRTRIVPPCHGDSSGVRGAAYLWP